MGSVVPAVVAGAAGSADWQTVCLSAASLSLAAGPDGCGMAAVHGGLAASPAAVPPGFGVFVLPRGSSAALCSAVAVASLEKAAPDAALFLSVAAAEGREAAAGKAAAWNGGFRVFSMEEDGFEGFAGTPREIVAAMSAEGLRMMTYARKSVMVSRMDGRTVMLPNAPYFRLDDGASVGETMFDPEREAGASRPTRPEPEGVYSPWRNYDRPSSFYGAGFRKDPSEGR